LGLTFFGLTSSYINGVYEQLFTMVMQSKFTFTELYCMPVNLRNWIYNRLVKHYEELNKTS